ncbi:LacI family DNA-binding transcriptional regulator [Microlunatus sp. Y2014]|uniref:LacI family DNA-binding transcriptional regulator n=1 Tax=Microlunatus sp. Y2014 TaxID=3418488 RepID=UPI003DA7333A
MTGSAPGDVVEPTRRRVLLKDVARAAGISPAQTSAALSGAPGVREATRERVRQVARDLGYQPSEHARLLGSRRRRFATRCAIVLNSPTAAPADGHGFVVGSFASRIVEGITVRASDLGMDIRLVHWPDLGRGVTTLAAQDGADAVLIPSYRGFSPRHVEELHASGLPFVLLNRHFDDAPVVPAVVPDVAAGAAEAVEHLVLNGHRRMALLTDEPNASIVTDYHAGWRKVTSRLGIADECGIVPVRHADARLLAAAIAGLLDVSPHPTAIVAVSELAAHRVLRAAEARGLVVPRDLSVVTFESVISPFTSPSLSGFDLQLDRIGARGVERVAAQLGLTTEPVTEGTERIRPRFMERESTGPAASQRRRSRSTAE